MPTTSKGLPYPSSSDHTRLWEHFQALAEALDAMIPYRVWTSDDLTVTYSGGAAGLTVTFPAGYFTAPPVVVAVGRDRVFSWGVGTITASTAELTGRRLDGTTTGSDTLRIIAIQLEA